MSTEYPYLHVASIYPGENNEQVPILLIHGAANGAWVWRFWLRELAGRGWETHALDLRGHGESQTIDLSTISMLDYVADVGRIAAGLRRPPIIIGWSMGGLIAQQYAALHAEIPAVVLFAPSPPAEIQGEATAADVALIPDLFGSEYYGLATPASATSVLADLEPAERDFVLARPGLESGRARRERKRGIHVDAAAIRSPVLVIYGGRDRHFPPELCRKIATYYHATTLVADGSKHWGMLASAKTVTDLAPLIDSWLRQALLSSS